MLHYVRQNMLRFVFLNKNIGIYGYIYWIAKLQKVDFGPILANKRGPINFLGSNFVDPEKNNGVSSLSIKISAFMDGF